jgi:hypothetical protein
MSFRLGMDGIVYYNSATWGTPTWVAVNNVGDVTLPMEAGEAEIKRRGSAFTEYLVALLDVGIEFSMPYDGTDTAWLKIAQTFFDRGTIDLLVMDGAVDVNGSQGLRMTAIITGFPKDEPLEEGMAFSVTAKPAPNANDGPGWWEVDTGTLTKIYPTPPE